MTNPVYAPGSDEDSQYREHVVDQPGHVARGRESSRPADFTDNGVGLIYTTGAKAVRLARKYAPLVPALADLIARPDTPLAGQVKARILGQLGSAADRFDAIIAASNDAADPGGR